jgi:acetyl-CoA acyltransferase
MKPVRSTFVIGGSHTKFIGKFHPDFIWKKHPDFGKKENPTVKEYIRDAALGAIENTGVKPEDIDKGYVGNFVGELFSKQGHLGAALAEVHPSFEYKPFMRVEGACASGGLAVSAGMDAIQAGADLVVVVGAEVQTTVSAKEGADYLARAADYATQRSIDDFAFPCLFARRTKAYFEKYGYNEADLAHVVVKAYANANRNPFAHMHTVKMSLENASAASDKNANFLGHPEFKDYLKVSDCSQVSDGGSAVILASEEGLKKAGKSREEAIEVLSYVYSAAPLAGDADVTKYVNSAQAARKAYAEAGVTPEDMKVAEIHDCFAISEILMIEALGFAEDGKGIELTKQGETAITGKIPVNTGGGLIAFGHPVGTTGVKQALEIYRQMKGQGGDYQGSPTPGYGITANMGGDDRTTVVAIYRN